MEPIVPHKKLEPGVYQGTPEPTTKAEIVVSTFPRLIRTMKSDTAEVVKQKNETFASITLSEEIKQKSLAGNQVQKEVVQAVPKRVGRMVVVAILILIISLSSLAYVFLLPRLGNLQMPDISFPSFGKPSTTNVATTTPVVEILALSLIPAQSEKRFNISTETLAQVLATITTERRAGNPVGSVKNLYFIEEGISVSDSVSVNRLFDFARISVPEILTRSLEKPFMLGFLGEETGSATPFVILKVSSYDTALAGMLEWETNLPHFFNVIFGTNTGSTATTKFHDIVALGKDARELNTPFGDTVAYAFVNQNTIVIAGSLTSLEALVTIAGRN